MNLRLLLPTALAIGIAVSADALGAAAAPGSSVLALVLTLAAGLAPLALPDVWRRPRGGFLPVLRLRRWLELAPLALYALIMLALGWGDLVNRAGVFEWPALWGIARLAPYLLVRATAEIAKARVTRLLHRERTPALAAAAGRLRMESLLLVPFLFLCAMEGLLGIGPLRRYAESVAALHWASLFANVAILLMAFPLLMRWCLGLRALPAGDHRDAIMHLIASHGFRMRDVLLWPGGEHSYYAGLVGVLPAFRYLVVSDGLLALLDRDELAAVVAHEVAHGVKRHAAQAVRFAGTIMILAYLVFALAFAARHPLLDLDRDGIDPIPLLAVAAFLVPAAFLMRSLLRHFELEADLFAAERTGTIAGLVTSLEKLAAMMGMRRERAGFRHPSIATRRGFLERVFGTPESTRFATAMRRVHKLGLAVFAGVLLLLAREVAVDSAFGLAAIAAREERRADARRYLEATLAIARGHAPSLIALLELQLDAHDQAARDTLNALVERAPRNRQARAELAQAIDDLRAERTANRDFAMGLELRDAAAVLGHGELH